MTRTNGNRRNYLFVSASEPHGAASALWAWPDGPADLCLISPSRQARTTAVFACAGRFVPIVDEPLLAGRGRAESPIDFADRFAQALRAVLAYDTRAALVVCDDLPRWWAAPRYADEDDVLRRSERIERELPLP